MASNKIKFQQVSKGDYTYSDISLDLDAEYVPLGSSGLFKLKNTNQLKVSLDERAIINSLINLFNTRKGQRHLYPEYGLDLRQYLFLPLSKFVARGIGREIVKGIENFEPRVKVKNIEVEIDEDNHQYNVLLIIKIPRLNNKEISLGGAIERNSL